MARNTNDVRVLIAGAGIAGLAAAISLTRQASIPNLKVVLYEQADELKEIGASIALSPNGMRTLERLGVHNALADELGFRSPSGIPQVFRHWKTNQVHSVDTHNDVPDPRHATTRFHRGHLHSALLEHVPRESIHLGKKTVRAEADHQSVSLYFDDGTSARADILIGADGLRSDGRMQIVRQSFIPQYKLRFSGKVFMRSTFDASLVEGKVPDLPADSIHWWGPKDNFFASRLGKQQYTTVGAYSDPRTTEEVEKTVSWDEEGGVEFLRERYKDWNPVVRALTEVTPYTKPYPNFIGDSLATWVLALRVTLIGDAAHAHGGAFAAGGSLALDDALTLGLAFGHALKGLDAEQSLLDSSIQLALELYSRARQPHTERLLRIVHRQASEGQGQSQVGDDEEQQLSRRLRNRASTVWLSEHDAEAAFAATVAKLEEENIAEKQSRKVKL
ncbi:FAD/NAD(P)-binding domain-containing protein [Aspergillus aculeatinus CBS 121060]|uniref:FAD/NAD(P)-binding domain-containing protein n=1 Tax=Aspergillus aculeatinus CBS 121060 TaxID=1448322 RepID=A0ACD1GT00_9EURO|nr:FAD/NAD(P)-binding domain-containing protein [Aspergillus aculeatinus CBS 121060]RAH64409.1 FAD/NAD(P)-binding domain-containing protein [Aspergillus aculeatinus CBS 121060]